MSTKEEHRNQFDELLSTIVEVFFDKPAITTAITVLHQHIHSADYTGYMFWIVNIHKLSNGELREFEMVLQRK